MDWNAAIEKNREALKRVLAMLVAMAGLDGGRPATLPRHLHRAVLSLLRPAEAAARRLIIVAARGIVVALPPARPRKPRPTSTILRNGIGTGIVMPPASGPAPALSRAARTPCLAALRSAAPLERAARGRRRAAFPRISVPGSTQPFPVPRRPRPTIRSTPRVLPCASARSAAALDDLPEQARRFARWQARAADRAQATVAGGGGRRIHRVTPLRPGRPPGGRLSRYDPDAWGGRKNIRDVDEILAHAHALASYALSPDTS